MHDLNDLAKRVGALLKEREETIAVAESSSGGLISAALLAVPGASAYYLGGSVIYTLKARTELLRISREELRGMKPLTEEYGIACARQARALLDATWGISELGAAGPTGTRYGHDAGVSCVAVSGPLERAEMLATGDNDRVENMWRFTAAALDLLERTLKEG